MKPKAMTIDLVAYLLHFDRPVQGKLHYLGSTPAPRLTRRLRDHATGSGANLTKDAGRMGVGFHVAAVWPIDSRQAEKRIKKNGHFARRCPFCAGSKTADAFPIDQIYYPAPVFSARHRLTEWPQT